MSGYKALAAALRRGETVRCATLCEEGPLLGEKGLLLQNGLLLCREGREGLFQGVFEKEGPAFGLCSCGGRLFFHERLSAAPALILCGGGHVGRKAAALGDLCGFAVSVLDDRPEFLAPSDFPKKTRLLCAPFEQGLAAAPGGENRYFVVATRGHLADLACVREVLKLPFAYLGMIGSKTKVAGTLATLRAEGVSQEKLSAIHAPIGLSIGAQTPAEIAVSIFAEIIAEKSKAGIGEVEEEVLSLLEKGPRPAVLASVIQKKGSAPRGAGARMVVNETGILAGTIGGGSVEHAAALRAAALLKEAAPAALADYDLSKKEASFLGMACGGDMTVLFEKL